MKTVTFAQQNAISKVKEINLGLYTNGTHHVFAYADVILIGDGMRIEINAGVVLKACKDIDLTVKVGKINRLNV